MRERATPAWRGLVGWLLASFAAAAVGALGSADAGAFYAQLARPAWAPPAGAFPLVWAVLYTSMGVAAWLVWRRAGFAGAGVALGLFIVQLVVNALWTWLFFVFREGALAFGAIVLLVVMVLATIVAFWRVRAPAGALLLPYLAWVSFAAALTFSAWRLNPALLG